MDIQTKNYLSHKLLLDSPPLVILKELAVALDSLDQAVALQQLHYLLWQSKQKGERENDAYKFRDAWWWVYNSYEQWHTDQFPFWSVSKIGRIFRDLEKMGIVISRQMGAAKYDQRKWYTINYEVLNAFLEQCTLHDDKLAPSDVPKQDDGTAQSGTVMSETSPKTSTDIPLSAGKTSPADLLDDALGKEHKGMPEPAPKRTAEEHRDEIQLASLRGMQRQGERPWLNWSNGRLKPRRGIDQESLDRIGWLIDKHTGLQVADSEWKGWTASCADIYQAGQGKWNAIEAGIKTAWGRSDPQYRPGHAQGFVKEVRKAASTEGGGIIIKVENKWG